jgi:hypothetical protein
LNYSERLKQWVNILSIMGFRAGKTILIHTCKWHIPSIYVQQVGAICNWGNMGIDFIPRMEGRTMPQIIPIGDLKNTSEVSQMCKGSGEAIFITKNGYGHGVLSPYSLFARPVLWLSLSR